MSRTELFEARFERIFEACGVRRDAELARLLNIRPQSIAAARKRKQIPFGWIETITDTFDVSADWLLFGIGGSTRKSDSATAPEPPTRIDWKNFHACENCVALLRALEQERDMNRELVAENRKLNAEGRQLLRNEICLRVELARLQAESERSLLRNEDGEQDCP
ncbi:MAG: helix-turn-helix domain-containing protein [Desulfovibrio sp.]